MYNGFKGNIPERFGGLSSPVEGMFETVPVPFDLLVTIVEVGHFGEEGVANLGW